MLCFSLYLFLFNILFISIYIMIIIKSLLIIESKVRPWLPPPQLRADYKPLSWQKSHNFPGQTSPGISSRCSFCGCHWSQRQGLPSDSHFFFLPKDECSWWHPHSVPYGALPARIADRRTRRRRQCSSAWWLVRDNLSALEASVVRSSC